MRNCFIFNFILLCIITSRIKYFDTKNIIVLFFFENDKKYTINLFFSIFK